jgi:hypothetical protein
VGMEQRGRPHAGPVAESCRAGAALLRSTLQASDLPDAAAALIGPPKPVILEHR